MNSKSPFLPRTFSLQKNSKYTNWTLKARELFFAKNQSFQTMKTECFAKSHFQLCFTVLWFCTFAKNAVELLVHFGQRDNFWSYREYFITRLVKSTKRKWVVTLYSIMYMICIPLSFDDKVPIFSSTFSIIKAVRTNIGSGGCVVYTARNSSSFIHR